jgi:hypothetical protein
VRVAVQINGIPPCPIWSKIAAEQGIDTLWLDSSPHHPPILEPNLDLVILQCAVRWFDLAALGWTGVQCPIVASCGDASPLCTTDTVFRNLPLLSRLYVVGYDYFEKYKSWSYGRPTHLHKFRYQHLCADNHFPPLPPEPKLYDWCFLGQVYPAYDVRLKHWRNDLIPQLLAVCPEAYVSGPGWEFIGKSGEWLDQSRLNGIYNQSRAIVSIDAHDGDGYASTRPIEAMHGGHCTLIYKHAGMHSFAEIVKEGEHALYFNDVSEFAAKMAWLRANPTEGQRIGAAARELVIVKGWMASAWMRDCLTAGK